MGFFAWRETSDTSTSNAFIKSIGHQKSNGLFCQLNIFGQITKKLLSTEFFDAMTTDPTLTQTFAYIYTSLTLAHPMVPVPAQWHQPLHS